MAPALLASAVTMAVPPITDAPAPTPEPASPTSAGERADGDFASRLAAVLGGRGTKAPAETAAGDGGDTDAPAEEGDGAAAAALFAVSVESAAVTALVPPAGGPVGGEAGATAPSVPGVGPLLPSAAAAPQASSEAAAAGGPGQATGATPPAPAAAEPLPTAVRTEPAATSDDPQPRPALADPKPAPAEPVGAAHSVSGAALARDGQAAAGGARAVLGATGESGRAVPGQAEPIAGPTREATEGPPGAVDVPPPGAETGRDDARHTDHGGGREPGRREIDGEVVVAGGLGHGESLEPRKAGGGSDPSAPSPLPPSPAREPAPAHRAAPAAPPGAVAHEVERLLKLDEMRAAARHDGGELRLEVAPDGLGRIEVRIAVRDDAVHASLYAGHDHARETLAAHRSSLEVALERSNLRLEGFSVGLGERRGDDAADLRGGGRRADGSLGVAPVLASAAPLPARALGAAGLSLRA